MAVHKKGDKSTEKSITTSTVASVPLSKTAIVSLINLPCINDSIKLFYIQKQRQLVAMPFYKMATTYKEVA
jgi:hypothetical protein